MIAPRPLSLGLQTTDAGAVLLAALIGAIVSLLVVFVQQSLQNRNKKRERVEQKRAVARAMLFEIDEFYKWYVKPTADALRETPPGGLPYFGRIYKGSFQVYENNSGHLGYLPAEVTQRIVRFYSMAEGFLSLLNNYDELLNRSTQGIAVSTTDELLKRTLAEMQSSAPKVEKIIHEVCSTISKYIGDPKISVPGISQPGVGSLI